MTSLENLPIEQDRTALIKAAYASILLARRNFLDFCLFTDKSYKTPRHIQFTAPYLEAVERGQIKRLMIFEPPRHGKSEQVSRKFPAYFLGRNPDKNIILASYAKSLCRTFSRKVRQNVESDEFEMLFPGVCTAEDSRSVDQWELQGHKGGLMAAGVQGAITGFGADVFIIDDPIKDRAEAESRVIRDNAFDWYQNVALTRLEPNGAMILMMTRWHQDDLAGRILQKEKDWVVLNLPALIEDEEQEKQDLLKRKINDALWPERFSRQNLEDLKGQVGSRTWTALYQGRPMDPGSQIIKRDWIRWYDNLPPETVRGGGIDTATSQKTTADNTAFVEVARDKEGFLYVDEVFCEQTSVDAFTSFYTNRVKIQKFSSVKIEENAAGEAIRQAVVKKCQALSVSPHPEGFRTSTDKVVRVMEFVAMIENGTIRFKRGNKKVEELVERLIDFPQGAVDDDVDALGFAIKAVMNGANINIRYL